MSAETSVAAAKKALLDELRANGISDERVLAAMESVPREDFVPDDLKSRAYDNAPLPIGHGQTISQPFIVAYMSEALRLDPLTRVLEIGTGSGYQAAILAHLCGAVFSVERHGALLEQAERRLNHLGLNNVRLRAGDGSRGWPEEAPFDRIVVTAAASEVPQSLVDQLKPGGLMVLPLERGKGWQSLVRLTRTPEGVSREDLLPVLFVPLVPGGAEEP